MLTSEETRDRLVKAGWTLNPLTRTSDCEEWFYGNIDEWDGATVELHRHRHAVKGDFYRILSFFAITGWCLGMCSNDDTGLRRADTMLAQALRALSPK